MSKKSTRGGYGPAVGDVGLLGIGRRAAEAENNGGKLMRKNGEAKGECGGFLGGQIEELRRMASLLLDRIADVGRESVALEEETVPEEEMAEKLTDAQDAITELYRRDRVAFDQSATFTGMLLRVTNETERASSAVLGERNGAAKATEEAVRSMRRRHPTDSIRALAREHGLSPCTIRDIVRRKTWKHVV